MRSTKQQPDKKSVPSIAFWCPILIVLVLSWCGYVAHYHWWRFALLTSLAAAAFIVGSLAGFIFTTYGEEANTVGKVKDWLIGALAGLTLVKFSSLHSVLLLFSFTTSSSDYALTLSVAVVFASVGFYFMYFGRELFFNIPLAEKRSQRNLIETTQQVGVITIQLNASLPSSVLLGSIGDAEELLKSDPEKASMLKSALGSADVQKFLDQAEEAIRVGRPLDWEVLSKVANLQYYRVYFVDAANRAGQQQTALDWIKRALILDPDHIDLTVKQADLLALLARYRECVAILEGLHPRPECPFYVEQWLGYYLLYLPGREDEAISCCRSYLGRFPESNETLRNLASAYAQKVCLAAKQSGAIDLTSSDYKTALKLLQEVIQINPDYLPTIQSKWAAPDGSFHCFGKDPAYQAITGRKPQ